MVSRFLGALGVSLPFDLRTAIFNHTARSALYLKGLGLCSSDITSHDSDSRAVLGSIQDSGHGGNFGKSIHEEVPGIQRGPLPRPR